jgi:hypothetical protein
MSATNSLNGEPRPALILAHPDSNYTADVGRSFRQLNWEVHPAHNADEVRRLARLHESALVVLGANLPGGETGWLTCEKLRNEFPGVRVALVADEPTPSLERFAQFVGAATLVGIHSAPAALLDLAEQTAAV